MSRTRILLLIGLTIAGLSIFVHASGLWQLAKSRNTFHLRNASPPTIPNALLAKTKAKASQAVNFATSRGFNTKTCFLIDMSLPSGQNRFFLYDMAGDSIKRSGLVAHGNCNQWWLSGRKYGNTVGCGCTSLGKYKVGSSYYGKFGKAFKLHGLEKTNDKAFQRFVVLHSYECVPETEVEDEICQSNGCPMVSVNFLKSLTATIANSQKPILLWIYE